MIDLGDIRPLTDFLRNHKSHIARLKRTGKPEVLTLNGKARLVVQDARAYQALLDLVDRVGAIDGVQRGLDDVKSGRTKSASKTLAELQSKLKIAGRE